MCLDVRSQGGDVVDGYSEQYVWYGCDGPKSVDDPGGG